MAQVDLSTISFFLPLISFLLVFIFSYAVLKKVDLLGDNPWVQLFVSFLISSIFVAASGSVSFVQNALPWVAVLLVSMVLILMFTGFVGGDLEKVGKSVGTIFVVLLFIVFIVTALVVYSAYVIPYLPGNLGLYEGSDTALNFFDWLYSPRVAGAILLLVVSALVSWVLVKTK
jgi:hypothetical protein